MRSSIPSCPNSRAASSHATSSGGTVTFCAPPATALPRDPPPPPAPGVHPSPDRSSRYSLLCRILHLLVDSSESVPRPPQEGLDRINTDTVGLGHLPHGPLPEVFALEDTPVFERQARERFVRARVRLA